MMLGLINMLTLNVCIVINRKVRNTCFFIVRLPKKNLLISGELKFFETKGSLGLNIKRGFCGNCGSGVLSYAKELPMLRFLKAGTLDDSSWVKVDSNFFSESAHDWNKVDKEVKSFKGNPDMISNIKAVLKAL